MKLFYSPTSPYSRKVRAIIIEKKLSNQITLYSCNPFDNPEELQRVNPLGKVPALLLENEDLLFDSPVLCEYLDS